MGRGDWECRAVYSLTSRPADRMKNSLSVEGRCYTFGAIVCRYILLLSKRIIGMWLNENWIPEWNGEMLYNLQAETTGIRRSHQRFASEWTMVSGTIMHLRKRRGEKNWNVQQRKVTKPSNKSKTKIQTIYKFKMPMVLLIISKG